MKIKNRSAYYQGVTNGRNKWGNIFEKYIVLLADALEKQIGDKKSFKAELVKEVNTQIQKDVLKSFLSEVLQKDAFMVLSNSWEYGPIIESLLKNKKL